jgi:uncharacterized membrane protein
MTESSVGPHRGPERLNALTDGVLAIVTTLLVLDIHVPSTSLSETSLLTFLAEMEHDMLVYAASFWLVGVYWLLHHLITAFVSLVNHRLLVINLAFLFACTLLPFLMKLKNAYPEDPLIALMFGLGHLACGLFLFAMWRYACAHPELVRSSIPHDARWRFSAGILLGCATSALASSVGFLDPRVGCYALMTIPSPTRSC